VITLSVRLRWSPTRIVTVGRWAHAERRVYFEYDGEFLARGLQISPFKLPLRAGLIEHGDVRFGPLPGVFDDSLPDGWGMLLMDRVFRRRGIDPTTVSPLDRLAYVGERAMGALSYHPPAETEPTSRVIDLHMLGNNARQIARGETVELLPQLARAGGSPAGARPKILVGMRGTELITGDDDLPEGFEPWIVKFAANEDRADAGPMEYAYSQMARAAGINMPPTRPIAAGKDVYFAVRRFDRGPQNSRVHVHTLANLIHADYRLPSTDYQTLLKVTQLLTRNHPDLLEAFRRMVFNIATHNRDDHAKNFAFTMSPSGQWSLSPAYDLVHSAGPGGEHTMAVMGEGRAPGREHVLAAAAQSGIDVADARYIIEQVNSAAAGWTRLAKEADCLPRTIRAIESTIQRI
jgi:serine/threonine-protein kinase HipA